MNRLSASQWYLGLAAALVAAVTVLVATSDRLPELTPGELDRAVAAWSEQPCKSYTMELTMEGTGLTLGRYIALVRDDHVLSVSRDGQAVASESLEAYSVPGLHGLLRQELELAKDPSRALGAPPGYRAYVYARFDDIGLPLRFRRVVGGTNRSAEWQLVTFGCEP